MRFALLLILSAMLGATIAARALGFQDYTSLTSYVDLEYVGPGVSRHTPGFNYRTENDACRQYQGGWEGVFYVNTIGGIYGESGAVWTYCSSGAVAIVYSPNGYFEADCVNAGTSTHLMSCWAWNYQP